MSRETRMRRLARIGMVAGLCAGFTGFTAASALAQAALATTHTSLTAETREFNGQTVATFRATVVSADGKPATGALTLLDRNANRAAGSGTARVRELASAALDAEGKTVLQVNGLTAGDHTLRAVYQGDNANATSQSEAVFVHPQVTATPDFTLTIAPTTLTVKQGNTGALVATITPVNNFTGFISLSLTGPAATTGTGGGTSLPVGVSYVFSPANLQVVAPTTANPSATVTANLILQTTTAGGKNAMNQGPANFPGAASPKSPLVLAILLPGIAGLGFLGRKRKLFKTASLLLAVAAISLLGTTACSARYGYLHHGPVFGGTPLGSYSLTVTAQTSDGVTASSHSQSLALTVN